MALRRTKPQQLLAEALRAAKAAGRDGIVRSTALSRKYREILSRENCLSKIIKGWYLLTSPAGGGSSTAWFGGIWPFLHHYLEQRFGKNGFCLSAESSFNIHTGDTSVPRQLVILTRKASNTNIDLPHNTSLLLITDKVNFPAAREKWQGLWIMRLPYALCRLGPAYFQKYPRNIEIALNSPTLSVPEISRSIFKYETLAAAERIIGAYKHLGEKNKAQQLKDNLLAAGYKIKAVDPFVGYKAKLQPPRPISPYAGRINAMWHTMREVISTTLPAPQAEINKQRAIELIQEKHQQDAYHSLSIEGYQVNSELIFKVESGQWDPENSGADRKDRDAMAAVGYHAAYKVVISSVGEVLDKENPGRVFATHLHSWHRQLFSPLVKSHLIPAAGLAGYRDQQVYISDSRHVPPPSQAVPDCMAELFALLENETNPAVRAILGHFIFVFIHPYMDGNGRIGRFLLNLMLVSGGYNWTIIKVDNRAQYMAALEEASCNENVLPLAEFIKSQMHKGTRVGKRSMNTTLYAF